MLRVCSVFGWFTLVSLVAQTCAGSDQTTLLAFGDLKTCFMLNIAACGQENQKEKVNARGGTQERERGVRLHDHP